MRKNTKQQPVNDVLDTTIAAGLRVRGDISSEGDIWIDGEIEGNVTTNAQAVIGENGVVIGNISGHTVIVHGAVEGNITADGSLSYEDTAQVRGESRTPTLQVSNGASLSGEVIMPLEDDDEDSHEEHDSDSHDME